MSIFKVGDYVEWDGMHPNTTMRGHIIEYDYDALVDFNPYDNSFMSYLVLVDNHWCAGAFNHGWRGREDSPRRYWWVRRNARSLSLVGKRPSRPFHVASPIFLGAAQ